MAIDFPTSPTVGQQYTYQGATYTFSAQGVWVQTSGGSSAISGLGVILRVITSSQTYVPSAGMMFCISEMVGGGAGGGFATAAAATWYAGGGGGAGAYSRSRFTAAQIGAGQAIVIGTGGAGGTGVGVVGAAGGDTTLGGTLQVAKGGLGGSASDGPATAGMIGQGGAGGPVAGSVGDLVTRGPPGNKGHYANLNAVADGSGEGGSSFFGGGGKTSLVAGTSTVGDAGGSYGSGGSGGYATGGSASGGAGSPGVVVITEYVASSASGSGSSSSSSGRPQGRLTLQTGVPVMVTSQAAKTAIFYTPYQGNQIPLYSGSAMVMTTFAELTVATTDTVSSPAAIGASKVNDWFVWDSGGGVLKLVHGPDWTSDTARSAGTALVMVNGILLNAVAITNGPPIQRGTYVGTTRSNASSQLDWILGTIALNGGAGFLGVWNAYNRVDVASSVGDTTDSWSYNGNTVIRASNNSATMRNSFVMGLQEDIVKSSFASVVTPPGATTNAVIGIGSDVTNTFFGTTGYFAVASSTAVQSSYYQSTYLGFHFHSACETTAGNAAATFYGDAGVPTMYQNLLSTELSM